MIYNFIDSYNPCSKNFSTIKDFWSLGKLDKAKVLLVTVVATVLSLGIGAIPVFRVLTRGFSKIDLKDPNKSIENKIDQVKNKIIIKELNKEKEEVKATKQEIKEEIKMGSEVENKEEKDIFKSISIRKNVSKEIKNMGIVSESVYLKFNPDEIFSDNELNNFFKRENEETIYIEINTKKISSEENLKKTIDLFSKLSNNNYNNVNIQIYGHQFDLTDGSGLMNGRLDSLWMNKTSADETMHLEGVDYPIHHPVLNSFSLLNKIKSNEITSKEKITLLKFVYTGKCTLDQASLCLPLLFKEQPLSYGYEYSDIKDVDWVKKKNEQKWDSEITWELSDNQVHKFFLHRCIVATTKAEELLHLMAPRDNILSEIKYNEREISLSNLTTLINHFYGEQTNWKDKSLYDLIQLTSKADEWGLNRSDNQMYHGLTNKLLKEILRRTTKEDWDPKNEYTSEDHTKLLEFAYSMNHLPLLTSFMEKAIKLKGPLALIFSLKDPNFIQYFLANGWLGLPYIMQHFSEEDFNTLTKDQRVSLYHGIHINLLKKENEAVKLNYHPNYIKEFKENIKNSQLWKCLNLDEENKNDLNVIALNNQLT